MIISICTLEIYSGQQSPFGDQGEYGSTVLREMLYKKELTGMFHSPVRAPSLCTVPALLFLPSQTT